MENRVGRRAELRYHAVCSQQLDVTHPEEELDLLLGRTNTRAGSYRVSDVA